MCQSSSCDTRCNACRRNLITGLTSAASLRVQISSTCKVGQKLGEILYLLICSFLPCLSWLLRSRVRKSRRDLRITLYIYTAFLDTFAKFRRRLLVLLCVSNCPSAWNNSNPNGWIFMKFDTSIFRKYVKNIKVPLNVTRIWDTLNDDHCTFMIISPSVLQRMRKVTDKSCTENQNIHLIFNNLF